MNASLGRKSMREQRIIRAWPLAMLGALVASAQAQAPPTPTQLVIESDDRVATLQWNGWWSQGWRQPENVGGYLVEWGPTTQPTQFRKYAALPVTQVQPLLPGISYRATIRAISPFGRLSAPLTSPTFAGNPARVDRLRKQMNGFFDDFNRPQGDPNLHLWSASYSTQNVIRSNGFFINDQFHVHNMIALGNPLGRGFTSVRPRQVFDIAGRTGTIVFDLDGSATNEDAWYLDIVPERMDSVERTNLDVHDSPGHVSEARFSPPNSLRFLLSGNKVLISWFRADGRQVTLAEGFTTSAGVSLVPNVRVPFRIRVNRTTAEVYVKDQLIARTTQLDIPWTQGHVLWTTFQYEAPEKWNQPGILMHWDNFGFDAPTRFVPMRTLAYRPDAGAGEDFRWSEEFAAQTLSVPVTQPLHGARSARLHFTRQVPQGYQSVWDSRDSILVNGHRVAVPDYSAHPGPSNFSAAPTSVAVPVTALRYGANTVTARFARSGVGNVHLELDYGPSPFPPVHQSGPPKQCPCCLVSPTQKFQLGPTVRIENWGDDWHAISNSVQAVSGVLDVRVHVNNDWTGHSTALVATGLESRMSRLELLINRNVVQTIQTAADTPAIGGTYTFRLDTRALGNGEYELFVRGISPEGYESVTDFVHSGGLPGQYRPVRIRVQN